MDLTQAFLTPFPFFPQYMYWQPLAFEFEKHLASICKQSHTISLRRQMSLVIKGFIPKRVHLV
jgi:hypothetical protein